MAQSSNGKFFFDFVSRVRENLSERIFLMELELDFAMTNILIYIYNYKINQYCLVVVKVVAEKIMETHLAL